jgi:hypothetical protein
MVVGINAGAGTRGDGSQETGDGRRLLTAGGAEDDDEVIHPDGQNVILRIPG